MSKTFLFRFLIGLSLLAAAVLWLLSVIPATSDTFTFTHGSVGQWAGLIITAGIGIAFLLRGIFSKNSVLFIKKLWVFFGIALITVAVFILIEIFTWGIPVMPIIAVALAAAFLFALIAVGGRRWDMGDNEKVNSQPAYKKTEWEKRQEQNRKQ